MAVFRCKMCGGDLLMTEGASTCTCEYCGTEQTVPTIKDDNLQGLFNRANVLRMKAEFDKAEEIYERILQSDESEAEAYWGLILCKYGIEYVEDPATLKRIPTCHRTSYEAITADEDYKNALKHADTTQRGIYEAEAKAIDDIQKGILAISQKEDSYDVFICYKETDENGRRTQDSVLANDIYYQLTQEGFKVFYAAITLEDKLGSEYEPYIFSALNTAKVMLCLGTRPEYFSAVWVKNEWSRFLKLMKKDRSKLLIPCYRDMDAYELPEEFAHLQAQDMSKIGFINDLVRGIRKVISKEAEIPTSKETTAESGNGANTTPLLRRAFMFLEDGDWKRADEFCEQVLNLDPENAQAYIGKLMAELKVRKQGNLVSCNRPFDNKNNYLRAVRFASPELKDELEGYVRSIKDRNETDRLNGLYAEAQRKYETAEMEEEYKAAASIFQSIAEWKDSAEKAVDALEKAEEARRQSIYEEAVHQADLNQIETYEKAIALLEDLQGWKDSDEKISEYESTIRELTEEEEREARARKEEERLEEERRAETAKKKKRRFKITAILTILVELVALTVYFAMKLVIIPNYQYRTAERLLSEGDYGGAIDKFTKLGGYKDSFAKLFEALDGAAETFEGNSEIAKVAMAYGKLGDYSDAREKSFNLWDRVACRDTIAVGSNHIVGLKSDGTVVADGENKRGQCNVFNWTDIIAVAADDLHTIGLKSDGTVVAIGYNDRGECDVYDWRDIVAIATSSLSTAGLKVDGTVVAVGENFEGQDASDWTDKEGQNISDWTDIVAIAVGARHMIGLKSNGTVVAVGDNKLGQCNVSDWEDIVAIAADGNYTVGLKSDGTAVAVGDNSTNKCNVSGWRNIIAITVGSDGPIGLISDGTLAFPGTNKHGSSDLRDIVAVGGSPAYLKSDGTVILTGYNHWEDVSTWSDIMLPKR